MESLLYAFQQLLPLLTLALGSPFVLYVTLYVRKLFNKAGIEETAAIEALVSAVVQKGVLYAEQQAARLAAEGDEADSGTKLEFATNFVLAQLKALGLAEMARDELIRRIEASVGEMNSAVE